MRIPEAQQHKAHRDKSDCAKRLCKLSNTASIRSKGVWCNGEAASESEKDWAESVWPFPVLQQLEVVNRLLSSCDGELA